MSFIRVRSRADSEAASADADMACRAVISIDAESELKPPTTNNVIIYYFSMNLRDAMILATLLSIGHHY